MSVAMRAQTGYRLCLAASVLAAPVLAACAEVKRGVEDVSRSIDDALGVERGGARTAGESQPGREAYEDGLAHLEAGEPEAAAAAFREAAEAGHPGAAYELALSYTRGRGVAQDPAAAARWMNVAAERGHAEAQYLTGAAYAAGDGVPQDHEKAARFFAKAAVQGHARAQYLLAQAFAAGRGVPRDGAWAARWYGKAAQQGHGDAQFAYGAMLAAGQSVVQDREGGYTWLRLAADGGHALAPPLLERLREEMPAAAVRRAEAAAERFRPVSAASLADAPTVRYVQQALSELGFDAGPVDGLMGPRTRAGLRAYQRANDLSADGELTPGLLRRLLEDRRARG